MVIARLDFESIADRDELLKQSADAAKKVASQEPAVACYRASIDIEEPTKVVLVERCWTVTCELGRSQ